MRKFCQLAVLFVLILAGLAIYSCLPHKTWVSQSNRLALKFINSVGSIQPEQATAIGLSAYNKKIFNIKKNSDEQFLVLYKNWDRRIDKKLMKLEKSRNARNDDLRIDLRILQDYIRNQINKLEIAKQYKVLPAIAGSSYIYHNISLLMNHQSSEKDKDDAVSRFIEYASPEQGIPFLTAHKAYLAAKIVSYKKSSEIVYPPYDQVQEYLKNSNVYLREIKSLLETSKRKDWQQAYNKFKNQLEAYDDFIAKKISHHASCIHKLPVAVYNQYLKDYGLIDTSIGQLIQNGKSSYAKEYQIYLEMAQKLAKKYHLKNNHPSTVINYLKTKKASNLADLQALYIDSANRLQQLVADKKIVTLPENNLSVRIATPAESKSIPAPNLYIPPYLQANTMQPEFVVPVLGEKLLYDDFAYPASAFGLTAHEGRPGHDLQIRKTYEQNHSSIIRATFAKNSTNLEGWALYAESLIFPYGTLEEQFAMQQLLLLRIARYYLDPMVHTGEADEKTVLNTLQRDLGISRELATVEYKRYAYLFPGQATSYYHGLLNIQKLKKELESTYGKLQLQCFNDTLLSFGLMPHHYIREFKSKFAECAVVN